MKHFLKSIIVKVLIFEARILLKKQKPKIIAITGSVGKTSTKDAIYAVLKDHIHVRKSDKNYNSEIGASLTILGLRNAWNNPVLWVKTLLDGFLHIVFAKEYPDVLVLELGIDRPGDMKRLTQFIKPDIVVLTRLPDVPSHVEFFASPDEVISEKMELVKALKSDGVLIYNNDDEKICSLVGEVRQQSFGYSRYSPSHFTASADTVLYDGAFPSSFEFTLTHINEQERIHVRGSLGVQHVYNYAAAAAVAHQFEIPLSAVAKALKSFTPPPGRMRIIAGVNDTLIIDDTYNSSPVACQRALQTIAELKSSKRKIAVLGDMLELGQFSVREHEHIGQLAASSVDMLVTLGVRSRKTAEAALEHGMSEKNILQYDDVKRAGEELRSLLKPGDIILVKGSQSVRAEYVVKAIMAEPQKATALLVRQDKAWEDR